MKKTKVNELEIPNYLSNDFADIYKYAKSTHLNNSNCQGHDFAHTLRVMNNQNIISQENPQDEKLLYTSGLLHDIIRPPSRGGGGHAILSANEARRVLPSFGYSSSEIKDIYRAIIEHNKYDIKQRSHLSKILFDADKLDLFGINGINRWLIFGTGDGLNETETLKGALRIQTNFLKQDQFHYDTSRELLAKEAGVFFEEIRSRLGETTFDKEIKKHNGENIVSPYIKL